MLRRTFIAAAACALALAGCSGESNDAPASGEKTAKSTADSMQKDVLTVGMELAYPPFEGKDASGAPAGVSVDFMKDFGKAIGKEIRIENIAFDGLVPALVTGKIDMIMSSMTITDARRETVDFSTPYANALLALLTKKDATIKSIDDLNAEGRTLAVKIGSTGHLFAQKHLTKAKITALADESACVMEVASGKADGFIYDQLTIYRNQQRNPDTTNAIFIPFQDVEPWGIAVRKGDNALREALDKFIADYRATGGFDRLTEKHLAAEKAAFEKLGFKWFFDFSSLK